MPLPMTVTEDAKNVRYLLLKCILEKKERKREMMSAFYLFYFREVQF
jgi:hypothetical protein